MKEILQDKSFAQLQALVAEAGERPFRAKQIADGLTQGKRIAELPVPPALRAFLAARYEDEPVRILKTLTAADGTKKYLFALADGNIVEGVLMKYKYGNTQCVSTQVGCRMGCKFCASTLGGLVRNLTAGEILSQILAVNRAEGGTRAKRAVTNVVLMGSGEPFDNYRNVVQFLRNLTADEGLGVSARNISLSTCGLVPQMRASSPYPFTPSPTRSAPAPCPWRTPIRSRISLPPAPIIFRRRGGGISLNTASSRARTAIWRTPRHWRIF